MFFHKTPTLLTRLFPDILWQVKTRNKEIYLTFDDGPIPEVTSWTLDQLSLYDAKATFFMVGNNIARHREVFKEVIDQGHSVGNHTNKHMNGWQTNNNEYLQNVEEAEVLFEGTNNKLFRPPYGRLKHTQYRRLKNDYKIIMWDVLSGDFSNKLTNEHCLNKSIKNTSTGSIIVFHDSVKSFDKLEYVLPRYMEHFSQQGYSFNSL
jgi:peptidoglycan/xylan/chitin deacetylase (PgdA/CDA1 family)